ncbi:MAG: hypothetical protein AAGB31_10420 [Bdellovibrio sp.]
MKTTNTDKNMREEVASKSYLEPLSEMSPKTHKSYHEMSHTPVVESDILTQLHGNIVMLEQLQARHAFLMREVRYLLKAE